jgi:integrase
MELLGHSSINLTLNTYSHVFAPALRDAANAMDAALGG